MTSEMRLFILDLHNAIADFDNDRLSGNGLRNEIAEIIADRLGSLEQGSYIHYVIIKVMANENTFKVIDMQSLIQQHMDGHISEQQLIEQCKAVLGRQADGGDTGERTYNIQFQYHICWYWDLYTYVICIGGGSNNII